MDSSHISVARSFLFLPQLDVIGTDMRRQ
jgi:hypothetical protein